MPRLVETLLPDRTEADDLEHARLCDALWDACPEDYKDRAEPRAGRVYFCDGVRAAQVALKNRSEDAGQ